MSKAFLLSAVILISLFASSISQASLLGTAGDYNAFILGDMNVSGSDSQGRVAAGGNINMSSYSIGTLASPATYSIVGGGNVTFGPGSVQNGGIFADGNIQLKNYGVYGNVISNGTVSRVGGTITGSTVQNAGAVNPINFSSEFGYLNSTSLALAAINATGTTSVAPWGTITLSGHNSVNYFYIDGSDLSKAKGLIFDIGIYDVAIINISGTNDTFSGFGIFGADGKEGNILYNFYEAETMSISNMGVRGSILAPNADVVFNSGVIRGSLIAGSLTGGGQTNQHLFDHDIPVNPVPEPATVVLLGSGLAGILGFGKKFIG